MNKKSFIVGVVCAISLSAATAATEEYQVVELTGATLSEVMANAINDNLQVAWLRDNGDSSGEYIVSIYDGNNIISSQPYFLPYDDGVDPFPYSKISGQDARFLFDGYWFREGGMTLQEDGKVSWVANWGYFYPHSTPTPSVYQYDGTSEITTVFDSNKTANGISSTGNSLIVWGEWDGWWRASNNESYTYRIYAYDGHNKTVMYSGESPALGVKVVGAGDEGQAAWVLEEGDHDRIIYASKEGVQAIPNSSVKYIEHIKMNRNGHLIWSAFDEVRTLYYFNGERTIKLSPDDLTVTHADINNLNQIAIALVDPMNNTTLVYYDGNEKRSLSLGEGQHQVKSLALGNGGHLVAAILEGRNYEIYAYDGTLIERVTKNSHDDLHPAVNSHGDITWEGKNGRVMLASKSGNIPPVANAGPDLLNLNLAEAVILDGTKSYGARGKTLTYEWSLTRPDGTDGKDDLSSPTSATPSFIPTMVGVYVASLSVNDGVRQSLFQDHVKMTVQNYTTTKIGLTRYSEFDLNDKGEAVWTYFYQDARSREHVYELHSYGEGESSLLFDFKSLTYGIYEMTSPVINNSGDIIWTIGDLREDGKDILAYFSGGVVHAIAENAYIENAQLSDSGDILWHESADGHSWTVRLYDGLHTTDLTTEELSLFSAINSNSDVVFEKSDPNKVTTDLYLYNGVDIERLTDNDIDEENISINNVGQIAYANIADKSVSVLDIASGSTKIIFDETNGEYVDAEIFISDIGSVLFGANDGDEFSVFIYDGSDVVKLNQSRVFYYSSYYSPPYQLSSNGIAMWEEDADLLVYRDNVIERVVVGEEKISTGDFLVNNNGEILYDGATSMILRMAKPKNPVGSP